MLYVPKPPKAHPPCTSEDLVYAWRQSFSPEEKQKLRNLDENNDCRRQVVRFLKGLCKEESTLSAITSYYWKTLLFHVMDKDNEPDSWKGEKLYLRTFELLEYMAKFVKEKKFPQYFLPEMNLFEDWDDKVTTQISNRLTSLYKDEKKFLKAVEKVDDELGSDDNVIDLD